MKKEKNDKKIVSRAGVSVLFIVMIILIISISAVLIVLGAIYNDVENWRSILTSVIKDLITAVIVTSIVGGFVKMITDNYFTVRKNDKMLRKFGVKNIGTGVSTQKDIHNIFGYDFLKIYPSEIRLLYITGNVYLKIFKKELINCLENGCTVKLLMVSTEADNIDFVRRLEKVYEKDGSEGNDGFVKQIEDVKQIVKELKEQFHDRISLRFYRDEYFYNFRSALYYDEKKETVVYKSNINLQPFSKPAGDCSIGLTGIYTSKDSEYDLKNNIFSLNNRAFDSLWETYKDTEYRV